MILTKNGIPICAINQKTIDITDLKILIMELEHENKTKR